MGRVRVAASALAFFAAALLAPALTLAAQPNALVEGQMSAPLKAEIERAVGVSKSRPTTRLDARRRAREAAQAAIAALRSEGYYDYQVEADVGAGTPPAPVVRVTPGPPTRIGQARIDWEGAPPDPATAAAAEAALDLPRGTPGRAAEVLAAEGRVEASLHAHGYADAATRPRQVVVDHAEHVMSPTFRFAAGSLVRLDGVRVTSKGRTRAPWVASLAPWRRGAIYDPRDLAKLERRLRDTGASSAVTVALAPASETEAGLRPVVVSLVDRAPRTIELGAGYSTSEGAGVDAKWSFYNLLGRADTVALTGRLAQIQQKLDAELDLPSWGGADQIFKTGGDIFADETVAFDDDGLGLRAGVTRHFTKSTFIAYGAAVDVVDTREKTAINPNGVAVGQELKLAIFSTSASFALDRSNDILNPTRGWRLQAEADPTYVTGDRVLPYLKLEAQASGYLPLGSEADTVLAGRVRVGSILGGGIPAVPADRRFFAGGGGSVRGFKYQGVGPQLADGTPVGGDSLFETSLEVRQHVFGPWGVVGFVDAGSLGAGFAPNFHEIDVGAGVGVRYNLGFGPLRFDIATPVTRRKGDPLAQIYISIGQSF